MSKPMTPELEERVKKCLIEGLTGKVVRTRFGIAESTVTNIKRRLSIEEKAVLKTNSKNRRGEW